MSSAAKKRRRSARWLARAESTEGSNERPRKKRKPARSTQSKRSQPEFSDPATPNLLSLPDEPLSLILFHMGASDTGGSFRGPRHAFALAQTNTRLLRLFGSLLTHITPDVSNPLLATLSSKHVASVVRLAGHDLRQIDLPKGCSEVLATLPKACPRLEALSFIEDSHLPLGTLVSLHRLGLRELAIENPSKASLCELARLVSELRLSNVSLEHYVELLDLLWHAPKKLHLEVRITNANDSRVDMLISGLLDACPQMEAVTISLDPNRTEGWERDWELFAERAAELITAARQNENESLCKSMKLQGYPAFQLLTCAHPRAAIELSSRGHTFGDDGDGLHLLRLRLGIQKPEFDISRLREVSISAERRDSALNATWKKALKQLKVKFAYVEALHSAKEVGLSADTVEIPFWRLCSFGNARERYRAKYWNWLSCARKVRLVKASHMIPRGGVEVFLRVLSFVLDECQGEVLWIEPISNLHAKYQQKRVNKLRPAFRAALAALRRFEDRGGDAGTVRGLLSTMRWTGSPD